MKRFFLIATIFFALPCFVFCQAFSNPPCTIAPANTDTGLISPYYNDSSSCIEQGLPYSASVQISMPVTFDGIVVLDSLVITSVTGLPAGISYEQNPASGVYYADSNGCIAFTGTTTADSGAYPLTFNGYAVVSTQNSGPHTLTFAQLAQFQDPPVPTYQLNIIYPGDQCVPQQAVVLGISDLIEQLQLNVYPNPSTGAFNVELNTEKALTGEITVCDVTGRKVYARHINASGFYKTAVDLDNCAKGLYMLQLKTPAGVVSKSISVQ